MNGPVLVALLIFGAILMGKRKASTEVVFRQGGRIAPARPAPTAPRQSERQVISPAAAAAPKLSAPSRSNFASTGGLVDVELTFLPPTANLILVLKAVREVTPLGLREAKSLVENLPHLLLAGVSDEQAQQARAHLTSVGAQVSIRPTA